MPGSSSFSNEARHQAQQILSKAPYRTTPSHTPRPLAGVLHALGRALNATLGHPAGWLYHHLLVHIGHGFKVAFGGWWVLVVGVLAVAVGVAVGVLIISRRARISARQTTSDGIGVTVDDPDDFDHRADVAETEGDHETAVRLRFRAGLVRLQRKGIVVNQVAQTDRQLSRRLHSPTFDALARRHEMIVYARDDATPADAATARTDWPRVLAETRHDGAETAQDDDALGVGARP